MSGEAAQSRRKKIPLMGRGRGKNVRKRKSFLEEAKKLVKFAVPSFSYQGCGPHTKVVMDWIVVSK